MIDATVLLIPFAVQFVCMAVDELYFHMQRKLPRWERLGHPIDTLSVVICFLWIWFFPPTTNNLIVYVLLAVGSCVCVTKDEFVHQKFCSGAEQWLHALLFILHPLIFISAGLIWPALHATPTIVSSFIRYTGYEGHFLLGNIVLMILFGLYQYFFWNHIWRPRPSK